jgi:peptidoglycan/xylan/chitin deacetylase (PgdA/CDA1 family)
MPNILYHFVGGDKRLKGISVDEFKKQLNFLQSKYSDDEIILTFDHGTVDHIETVASELENRGIRGYFFILTMIPEEHKVPTVDKQRYLEAEHRYDLAELLCAELYVDYDPQVAKDHLRHFPFYSLEERYLRYLRDNIIPRRVYDSVIGNMFHKTFGAEKDFCLQQYLGWHHIYQLHKRGHIIGSHSHYHYGDMKDYAKSLKLIEGVIDEKPRCISYPNGVKRISDEDLRNLGVQTAYIAGPNGAYPYRAALIDCNQLEVPESIS